MSETTEKNEASGEAPSILRHDFESGDRVEVRPNGNIRIGAHGLCCEMPPANWVRAYSEAIPESKHIDAVMQALDWHCGPAVRRQVRIKYLELMNQDASHLRIGDPSPEQGAAYLSRKGDA